jgi:hypothetical protein
MEEIVKTPLEMRREEVAQYTANIAMYQSIAAGLPSEWPSNLAHLKGSADQHSAIANVDDLEDVALVSKLWAHDAAQAAIRAEMVERAKAEAILAVLEANA